MLLNSNDEKEIKKFGENLRRIRNEKNLSMETLANEAEIEISQIYRIEIGRINPKLTTIINIAKALKISPKDFF